MTTPPRTLVKMPKRESPDYKEPHELTLSELAYYKALASHHASVEAALMPYVRHDRECYAPHEPCCCGLSALLTAIEESKK